MSKIILTGDRPTGRLHVGHYVGSLKRRVELQNSGEYDSVYIMIADAQALTDNFDNPDKVRSNISEVALDYMSCGLDPAKSTLFVQSGSLTLCLPLDFHNPLQHSPLRLIFLSNFKIFLVLVCHCVV